MEEILNTIKRIASFADHSAEALQPVYGFVVFQKGEVWAQTPKGGACAEIGLKLDCAVEAKRLIKALKAMKGDAELTKEGSRLKMESDGARVAMPAESLSGLPKLHKPGKVDWAEISGMDRLGDLAWCVSKDPFRRQMSGLHFQALNAETFVVEACDGNAMVRNELAGDISALGSLIAEPGMLQDLPQTVKLARKGNQLFVLVEEGEWRVMNLLDAEFPPLEQILNSATQQPSFRISRSQALDTMKRAKLSRNMGKLTVSGKRLVVEVETDSAPVQSLFDFAASIPFVEDAEIPEGHASFNLGLLVPLFNSASSDEVTIHLRPAKGGGLEPLVLRDGGFVGMLMPMRG